MHNYLKRQYCESVPLFWDRLFAENPIDPALRGGLFGHSEHKPIPMSGISAGGRRHDNGFPAEPINKGCLGCQCTADTKPRGVEAGFSD
jgi:hypothetical protein